ncbi:hypothetical protein IOK49_05350 [Fervidicoccus fontis]|jgi:SpoU rRNA methylase family enzyme|uniref:Exonuclease n=2 Tax=Fervidicoccus fontis TaxID=683846 RepID=I0A1U0_FERFK|nr:RecB-family nuclease [Fervidicoccus fontis]AFH42947.1 hypothetical protein FFONT_0959 [Fervidicoccus fontis Kam940]MBE9391497.1 hypothetical protein [Fervidicoccus fontis]PMB77156.1 MAG: hypothetical protein C0177_04050 [Fervidicoccus fontis]HEW63642.1 hypothetical protein [Fervidicoccus fontis]
MVEIVVGLHDISSTYRLSDFFKTVQAYKKFINTFAISRVTGAAAQYGIAEISKALFKSNVNFLILQDIGDFLQFFQGYKIFQFTQAYGVEFKSLEQLGLKDNDRILLIFSGNDVGFGKNELLPNATYLKISGIEKELPPQVEFGIFMSMLAKNILIS